MILGVLEAHAGLQNLPVDAVLGLQEVHVAGGAHRLMEGVAQLEDGAIKVPQLLLALGQFLIQQEAVVGQGLDLQIIVEGGQLHQLAPGAARHHGVKQLTCHAGRAKNEVFTGGGQFGHGDDGTAVEIFQMGVGNQLVQSDQTGPVFHQNHQVIALLLFVGTGAGTQLTQGPVDFGNLGDATLLLQHRDEPQEDLGQHLGIVGGPVMVEFEAQCVGDDVQLVLVQLRHEGPGDLHRVD